jgi:hypothetical protein
MRRIGRQRCIDNGIHDAGVVTLGDGLVSACDETGQPL